MGAQRRRGIARCAAVVVSAALASCSEQQSVLHPEGEVADRILHLFWAVTAMSAVVWLLVAAALVAALLRRLEPRSEAADERRLMRIVGAATAATVVILVAVTLASYLTTRAFGSPPPGALTITLIARQWWWEAQYRGADLSGGFVTANEIHIPAGKPVTFVLQSPDVIHSFWVPNLAGKQDLIPGRTNTITIVASQPGIYRGQCAEFCGLQHAHMALQIVADSERDFNRWREAQALEAAAPADAARAMGRDIVLSTGCIACHTIRGTPANGSGGPDLTHVASRKTIAAGTLANNRANLQAWIADPQKIKPGTQMPSFAFDAGMLNAICDYLAGLT